MKSDFHNLRPSVQLHRFVAAIQTLKLCRYLCPISEAGKAEKFSANCKRCTIEKRFGRFASSEKELVHACMGRQNDVSSLSKAICRCCARQAMWHRCARKQKQCNEVHIFLSNHMLLGVGGLTSTHGLGLGFKSKNSANRPWFFACTIAENHSFILKKQHSGGQQNSHIFVKLARHIWQTARGYL